MKKDRKNYLKTYYQINKTKLTEDQRKRRALNRKLKDKKKNIILFSSKRAEKLHLLAFNRISKLVEYYKKTGILQKNNQYPTILMDLNNFTIRYKDNIQNENLSTIPLDTLSSI